MSRASIENIRSLKNVLEYVKSHENPKELQLAFDYDDTIIDVNTDKLMEPEETKELFDYLHKNDIHYLIITARYYDSVCHDHKRDLEDMEINVIETIHPILQELGIHVKDRQTNKMKRECYKVVDENNNCVGIVYMGIMFSGYKGSMLKHWLRHNKLEKHVVFIDDYDEYLKSVSYHLPNSKIFKRYPPNY